jgi:hypothetical protein
MNLTDYIASWETFFLLAGTAAATLIGLLFIAISIHLNIFHEQTSIHLQRFAALTFNCFFYVLLIAMIFLIPGLTSGWLGAPLLLLGVLGTGNALRQRNRAREEPHIANKFNAPIVGLMGLAIIGALVLFQVYQGIYGLVFVILIFLISASLNAWNLLIYTDDPAS